MNTLTARKILVGTASLALGLSLAACGGDDDDNDVGLANPASEFCVEQGGEVVIEDGADGQVGICEIDGERIDEWEYYRANHESVGLANPASEFCVEQGGEVVIEDGADGQVGICEIDGERIDEWEYFRANQ